MLAVVPLLNMDKKSSDTTMIPMILQDILDTKEALFRPSYVTNMDKKLIDSMVSPAVPQDILDVA